VVLLSYLNMNSSSTPANNETVAYGQLLAMSGKLKRADQVNLVRALAGQLGMIAMFPAQIPLGSAGAAPAKAGKAQKEKGPAKQAPSNPLSGSPEKKAFDAAKKAVAKATKDAGVAKLPGDHALVLALESAKDKYFRALSSAKGENGSPAKPAVPTTSSPKAAKAEPLPREERSSPPKEANHGKERRR